MQQAERVRQHSFSIEGRSNSFRILKKPVKPVVIKSQPTDLETTNILQESFEEGFQLELLAFEFKREDFLRDGAFSVIEDMPVFLEDSLRAYASSQSVKGLVIIAGEGEIGGILIEVLREPSIEETDADRIRLSAVGINLKRHNVVTEWVNLEGKPFEDVEKEIRDEVWQTPDVMLGGIVKFTD